MSNRIGNGGAGVPPVQHSVATCLMIVRMIVALAAAAAIIALLATPALAQQETLLYSFTGSNGDGANPWAGLVMDKEGNLYGTTYYGGASGYGTVFKVSPSGTETVLHSFTGTNGDGAFPYYGALIIDAQGNLYGTTSLGGTGQACKGDPVGGCGTVFRVSPNGAETVLYSFTGQPDGVWPEAGLLMDKKGNLYGTTVSGGAHNQGTVFELSANGEEAILHSFNRNGTDGTGPVAGLIMGKKGALYGTTEVGGAGHDCYEACGTVFEVSASGVETILHSFNNNGDGYYPEDRLVMDKEGNLYGTTGNGGDSLKCTEGCGTVFEVSASGVETVLHSFNNDGTDGYYPYAGLITDKQGNLYGTTIEGGTYQEGTVFELSPSGVETILYSFPSSSTDGTYPYGGLIRDKKGNLYGTTLDGGKYGYGTVYKLSP